MTTAPITAPRDRSVTVIIYEPEQTPGQGTVELDRFDLEAGETREVEIRSATAAYKFESNAERFERTPGNSEPAPDQEPIHGDLNPYTADEMEAGKARTRDYELAQDGETARLENQKAEEDAAREAAAAEEATAAKASKRKPPEPEQPAAE